MLPDLGNHLRGRCVVCDPVTFRFSLRALATPPLPPLAAPQLLAMIGEQFTEGDALCGLYVNIRAKGDRCELWTSNIATEAMQARGPSLPLSSFFTRCAPPPKPGSIPRRLGTPLTFFVSCASHSPS